MAAILEFKNVDVYYGAIHALKDISFKIEEGEIVTLIGCNGAGKSTTLRTISGLLHPKNGEVSFQQKPIHHLPAHQIVSLGITHSPEGRMLFPEMTVFENLEMGSYLRKDKLQVKKDLDYVYSIFPRVLERKDQLAGTLSGGEQQMVAISRALMGNPKLLLLDEPSLGIAPLLVKTIFHAIHEINKKGVSILLVEQNAYQALKISNRGLVLETGSIKMSGLSSELLGNDEVKKAYLGM